MSKKIIIDARGLACPEPLIAFTGAISDQAVDQIEISFDCGAARDNITRAAASASWDVDSVSERDGCTTLTLSKKA